jgi:Secretion system C-terminal sorting domain/HYDIN/CFA65/VesB-like, Ig-like domain
MRKIMKLTLIAILCNVLLFPVFSQTQFEYKSAILKTEEFPKLTNDAVKLAAKRKLPTSISLKGQAFIQPVIVKNNEVIYSVITDLLHPLQNGYLATFNEIENKFDLNNANIKYFEDRIRTSKNNNKILAAGDSLYLIPESTNKRVMAFTTSGVLLDSVFITDMPLDTLNTPIKILYHKDRKTFLITDQVLDIVQEFDTTGTYLRTFAPRGGKSVNILDNIRGMAFHPNDNLLVSNAGGLNQDAIAGFDLFGTFRDNFIAPMDSIMDSPFDVLVRTSDVLIPGINTDGIHKYDLAGNYIEDFATGVAFPEQIIELRNGDIAVANFNGESGIQIYPSNGGAYSQLLSGVTNNRGVAELNNGNLLTTNSSGAHIIDRATGSFINTVREDVSARFISLYVVEEFMGNSFFSPSTNIIDFGSVIKDSTITDTIVVNNSGTVDLLVYSAISNNPNITIIPDTGRIAVSDSMLFEVTFTAIQDTGNENSFIVFEHNTPSRYDTIDFVVNIATGLMNNPVYLLNSYKLSQNYPNPFNPETVINYQIPKSDFVNLTVYNVQGKKVATIINNQKVAGKHSVIWNASEFSSGVYYFVLKAGNNFKETKKMLLIK